MCDDKCHEVKNKEKMKSWFYLSGSQGGGTSGAAGPVISQFNPFGRPGGTILLPAPPAPGPSRDQASSSSLGLQMSQGHSQMYGGRLNEDVEDISLIVWGFSFYFISFI